MSRETELKQPPLVPIGASGIWRLYCDWEAPLPRGGIIRLPEGVVTDLASVPQILQWLIDDDELGSAAPLVHDVLYRTGGVLPDGWLDPPRRISRKETDELLYLFSLMSGCPKWKAYSAWLAVRLFAGPAWGSSKRR